MLKIESTGWQIMNCANRGRFKWNQHVEMQNQQVDYDNFQLLHTTTYFYETNAWVHKINMLQTHQTTFLMSKIPTSVLSLIKLSLANGFVNKSAKWFFSFNNFDFTISLLNMIMNEMMPNLYMLGFRMLYWILG